VSISPQAASEEIKSELRIYNPHHRLLQRSGPRREWKRIAGLQIAAFHVTQEIPPLFPLCRPICHFEKSPIPSFTSPRNSGLPPSDTRIENLTPSLVAVGTLNPLRPPIIISKLAHTHLVHAHAVKGQPSSQRRRLAIHRHLPNHHLPFCAVHGRVEVTPPDSTAPTLKSSFRSLRTQQLSIPRPP